MTLVIAAPIDGADLWSADVKLGWAENLRALSHEMPIDTVFAYAKDVVRSRNRLVARALSEFPQMTHVLWWDSDQWPESRAIVGEMMATGEDFVAAPYTNKRPPLRWIHQLLNPCPVAVKGLQEVRYAGFGFTMTSRACLEKMSAAHRKYRDAPNDLRVSNIFGQLYDQERPGPYYTAEEDEMLLSEDFSFCKRWRDLGGKVKLYLGSGIIVHAGTHGFSARELPGGILPG